MEQEQPQVKTEAPVDTNEPVFHDDNKKSSPTGLIIGLVLLALIAAGGVGFGVWQMMQGSSKDKQIADLKTQVTNCANADSGSDTEATTVTCPDGTEVKVEKIIDNASAQTIVDPYLVHFGAFSNMLDYEFDTDAKMKVTLDNMGANQVHSATMMGEWAVTVSYDDFVREYKYLFGSSQEVEKRDYDTDYTDFTYLDSEGTSGSFKANLGGIGGTGMTMFSVVKKAYYSGDNLLIEVYHGSASWCVGERTDACVAQYSLANSEEIKKYINDYAESIPVYAMTFTKDNGHYVLTNIQKQ